MKRKQVVNLLVILIAILAFISSLVGVTSNDSYPLKEITSVNGETVELYGKGIYHNDSVSAVAQGIAQDYVILILGIGILLYALYLYNKKDLKGKILLSGMLGFYLYTYLSYTMLWNYNQFFLIYVALMGLSLYSFIMVITSIKTDDLSSRFNTKLKTKFLGWFQIIIGVLLFLMWMGRIVPSLLDSSVVPVGLDHYTTLVIQAMDLGIILPAALISGISLLKKKNIGYLLSSVIIVKSVALLTSISAMIIGMIISGVEVSIIEIIVFTTFNLISFYALYNLIKSIEEKDDLILT